MMEAQGKEEKKVNEGLKKVTIAVVSTAVIILLFLILNNWIIQIKRKQFTETQNNELLHYIEEVRCSDKEIQVTGWAFLTGFQASEQSLDLICRDIYSGELICCDSINKQDREDINNYYLCETDYTECGFTAKIKNRSQRLVNGCYEILLRVKIKYKNEAGKIQNKDITVSTLHYITDGQLTAYRPDEFDAIEKTGTLIDEIIEQGTLLFYRRAEGVYLYQYQNFLYWITNEDFYFTEENKTYIQYQLWTTQTDKLPKHRLENNWLWDNIRFYFETNEINNVAIQDYRITRCRIPMEYSIKYFVTGYHEDGAWKWKRYVHPDVRMVIQNIENEYEGNL